MMYPNPAADGPRETYRSAMSSVSEGRSPASFITSPRAAIMRLRNLFQQGMDELTGPRAPAPAPVIVGLTKGVPRLLGKGIESPVPLTVNGKVTTQAQSILNSKNVDIGLSSHSSIDLEFSLPNSPLSDLREMVETEIAFRSPFGDDTAYAIWTADEADDDSWRIRAAVTLKSALDPVFEALGNSGATLASVRRIKEGAVPGFAAQPAWAVLPGRPVAIQKKNRPVPLVIAGAAAALLLVTATGLYISATLSESRLQAEAQVASAQLAKQAQEAKARQGQLGIERSSLQKILMPGILAQVLPDTVWLEQVAVASDSLTITGYGPSAGDVTRQLSSIPGLTDIKFASPVTRDNTQGIERFRIIATLVPDQFGDN